MRRKKGGRKCDKNMKKDRMTKNRQNDIKAKKEERQKEKRQNDIKTK